MSEHFSVKPYADVENFAAHTDVIVCGFGGAGGSAGLEAARGVRRLFYLSAQAGRAALPDYQVVKCILAGQAARNYKKIWGLKIALKT